MKLTSMKCDPYKESVPAAVPDGPRYPGGLCLYLDEECLKKLGIKELPKLGDKLMLMAEVEVTRTSENESLYGVHRELGLQIVAMSLGEEKA